MKYILSLLVIIFCFLIKPANAQWVQTNGPYGGRVNCFAYCGVKLFAGTSNGVYLSTDNGQNWSEVNSGLIYKNVHALIVSGSNIFAGIYGGGVFLTTNNGENWTEVNNGFNEWTGVPVQYIIVNTFALSDSNLFCGTNQGVFLTTNDGKNWNAVTNNINHYDILSLASNGNKIFAMTDYSIYLTTDNGKFWSSVFPLISDRPKSYIYAKDSNIYVGTSGEGVFYSSDSGENWTQIQKGRIFVNSIFIVDTNLFIGTSDGIYISSDNGINWKNIGLKNPWITSFISNPEFPEKLLVGTYGGVFQTTDKGTSWKETSIGMNNTFVQSLVISDSNIFAGTYGGGVHLSTNNGESWTSINEDLTNYFIQTIAVDDTNIYVGTNYDGVFLSTNNGENWINVGLKYNDVRKLSIDPYNKETIYAGTLTDIYITTNKGGKWSNIRVNKGSTTSSFIIKDTIVFAGTASGVYFTTNNGINWSVINNGLTDSIICSLAVSGSNIFAGTYYGGIFLSTNNGIEWIGVNSGLPDSSNIYSFAIIDSNIFAGTSNGVFLTTNNGESWIDVNKGIFVSSVYSLINNDSNIFAGTYLGCVWRRPLSEMITDVKDEYIENPSQLTLEQNYPNPFNSNTDIKYGIPKEGNVIIKIYDIQGQLVKNLVSGYETAGSHTISWDGRDETGMGVFTGVYIYRIQSQGQSISKKMFFIP